MDISYHKNKILVVFLLCCSISIACFFIFSEDIKKTFNIAVVGPMTGKNSANGQSMVKGINLCLQNARNING